jgi:Sec-independent protein secretion pathway component TatC
VSQFMLAIPLWLLYEAGIWVAVWMTKTPKVTDTKIDEV